MSWLEWDDLWPSWVEPLRSSSSRILWRSVANQLYESCVQWLGNDKSVWFDQKSAASRELDPQGIPVLPIWLMSHDILIRINERWSFYWCEWTILKNDWFSGRSASGTIPNFSIVARHELCFFRFPNLFPYPLSQFPNLSVVIRSREPDDQASSIHRNLPNDPNRIPNPIQPLACRHNHRPNGRFPMRAHWYLRLDRASWSNRSPSSRLHTSGRCAPRASDVFWGRRGLFRATRTRALWHFPSEQRSCSSGTIIHGQFTSIVIGYYVTDPKRPSRVMKTRSCTNILGNILYIDRGHQTWRGSLAILNV
jgi:hypothetical protein